MNEALLSVRGLEVRFPVRRGMLSLSQRPKDFVRAVDGVDLDIQRGETLGLVGESGCGKSTTGRAILQLVRPTAGSVVFAGKELTQLRAAELRRMRRHMQIVFQNPYSSLDPRMTIGSIVAEPLQVHHVARGRELRERVRELLELVGLDPQHLRRYPHEFSGGQRQRVGIARAIALHPEFIVADEPISALDVSIQAQILNLLQDLQQKLGLTYLFIAHDLAVVRYISTRIAVMYLGKLVEVAEAERLIERPLHPYTQALIAAVPVPEPERQRARQHIVLPGEVPSPVHPPSGCRFRTRCAWAFERCATEEPMLREWEGGHTVACHLMEEADPPHLRGRIVPAAVR
ncbi:MAG TPA: ABC transporter ATP-binding protein [Candidatus Krumholzibacteria bacterium]|nr:ABC transporter ATP-binding protein [Candidatus Krumholzibacteria bacterium]